MVFRAFTAFSKCSYFSQGAEEEAAHRLHGERREVRPDLRPRDRCRSFFCELQTEIWGGARTRLCPQMNVTRNGVPREESEALRLPAAAASQARLAREGVRLHRGVHEPGEADLNG